MRHYIDNITLVLTLTGIFCFVNTFGQGGGDGTPVRELEADRVLGPGGGGAMIFLGINPHDHNNLFASSDMSSCYVSHDGGKSWIQPYRFRHDAHWYFGSDENTVYAVTIRHTFVSKDKGRTWNPLYPGKNEFDRKGSDGYLNTDWSDELGDKPLFITLLQEPDDPNIIYILTENGRIVRSTNGGATFSYITTKANSLNFNGGTDNNYFDFARLEIEPTTNLSNRKLTLLARTGIYSFDVNDGKWTTRKSLTALSSTSGTLPVNAVANAGQILLDGVNTLLYIKLISSLKNFESELAVSSDFGNTWKVISTNIQNVYPTGVSEIKIFNFTIVNKDVIYLSVTLSGDAARNERIVKTTDGGNTWNMVLNGGSNSVISNRGWNENLWGGTSWTRLNSNSDLLSRDFNSMATTSTNPNICLSGTWGNVLATTDGGATWKQLNSDLAVPQPALPADAPASVTNNNGAYQFYKTRGMDQTTAYSFQIDPFNPNHQFICYTDIGLWETYDDGESWRLANRGTAIGSGENMDNCYDLAFDPNKKNRVYSVWGSGNNDMTAVSGQTRFFNAYNNSSTMIGGVCYSVNGGYSWTRAAGIPSSGVQGMGISVDPVSDNDVVYAAIAGYNNVGGIYRSTNGGESYTRFMNGVAARDVFPFSLEWNADASRLFVTFIPVPHTTAYARAYTSYNYNSDNAGAYYLDRGSDTWQPVTLPSSVYAVNRFKCDPVNPDVVYMVARRRGSVSNPDMYPSNAGIYVSKDAGKTWRLITSTNINTVAVEISNFDTNRIYFAESSVFFNGGMVYYSDNGPDTQPNDWEPVNLNFHFTRINNVQQDPQNPGAIYVSCFGASVWHLTVPFTYAEKKKCEKLGEHFPAGDINLCNGNTLSYNISKLVDINDVEIIEWSINPPSAGTIISDSEKGETAIVEWIPDFQPPIAELTYNIQMTDASECESQPLIVNLNNKNKHPPVPEGLVEIKEQEDFTTIYTAEQGFDNYEWYVVPNSAYKEKLNIDETLFVTWENNFAGKANISYETKDECGNKISPELTITILPAAPDVDDLSPCRGASTTVTAPNFVNTTEYSWSITPENAGNITENGSSAIIDWLSIFEEGKVYISYTVSVGDEKFSSPEIELNIRPLPAKPPVATGPTTVIPGIDAMTYMAIEEMNEWEWEIEPSESITTKINSDNLLMVAWNENYEGLVNISYKIKNDCGWSDMSEPLVIEIFQVEENIFVPHPELDIDYTPTLTLADLELSDGYSWLYPSTKLEVGDDQQFHAIYIEPGGNNKPAYGFITVNVAKAEIVIDPTSPEVSDKNPCINSSTAVTAPNYAGATYSWNIEPEDAGNITENGSTATIVWNQAGKVNIGYTVNVETKPYQSPTVEVDVRPLPTTPTIATGQTNITSVKSAMIYTAAAGMTEYIWDIQPSEAITTKINSVNLLMVAWNENYAGKANISYRTKNICGVSVNSSPDLTVIIHPAPPDVDNSSPCTGSSVSATATNYQNATGYDWHIQPENAGNITQNGASAIIHLNQNFAEGKISIGYTVYIEEDDYSSQTVDIDVHPLPQTPPLSTGLTRIISENYPVTYKAVAGMNNYFWEIQPSNAYTSIQNNENTLSITWNNNYIGKANISYKTQNNCGVSINSSPDLTVTLLPAAPEMEQNFACAGIETLVFAPNYQNAASYKWNIYPIDAGQIEEKREQAIIKWNNKYETANVSYTVTNTAEDSYSSSEIWVFILDVPPKPSIATGQILVNLANPITTYNATSASIQYQWNITPSIAAEIQNQTNIAASIVWNQSFIGDAMVAYRIGNDCGWSEMSEPLTVTVYKDEVFEPAPPEISVQNPCSGTLSTIFAPEYENVSTYHWIISPSDAGEIEDNGNQAIIRWSNIFSGEAEIHYTVETLTQESYSSPKLSVIVTEVLDKPSIASGPDKVFLNSPVVIYTATSAGIEYEWKVTPPEAAEIKNPESEKTSVLWNNAYRGQASIEYRIGNECGLSEMSDPLFVNIYQTELMEDIQEIFTPNGDGINDYWDIPAIQQYPEAIISIYNRAKKLIVQFKGAQMPWDGRDSKGNLLENGYYLYQIELPKGGKAISGYVTILR